MALDPIVIGDIRIPGGFKASDIAYSAPQTIWSGGGDSGPTESMSQPYWTLHNASSYFPWTNWGDIPNSNNFYISGDEQGNPTSMRLKVGRTTALDMPLLHQGDYYTPDLARATSAYWDTNDGGVLGGLMPMAALAANFIPGVGPVLGTALNAYGAYQGIKSGNPLQAIAGAAGALGGLGQLGALGKVGNSIAPIARTVQSGAGVADALRRDDPFGALSSGANFAGNMGWVDASNPWLNAARMVGTLGGLAQGATGPVAAGAQSPAAPPAPPTPPSGAAPNTGPLGQMQIAAYQPPPRPVLPQASLQAWYPQRGPWLPPWMPPRQQFGAGMPGMVPNFYYPGGAPYNAPSSVFGPSGAINPNDPSAGLFGWGGGVGG